MSDAGKIEHQIAPGALRSRSATEVAVSVALGFVAVLVGLGATMAGAWIAYWHGAALVPFAGMTAAPEPDTVSLYLVVCGTATTILGGLSISRSQDM
jgi:hypothetical protein